MPPSMTEATFLEQIKPVPEHDHMYFAQADWSLTVNATCRAYFNFVHQEDVFIFKEKFNGYIFVDAKGNEYPAIVEFAPFQRMGRGRSKKVDRKCNTYETSEHFLNFCRTLDTEEAIPKLELRSDFDVKQENQRKMTPLLEFLNDKKSRRRDRDRKQQQQDKKGGATEKKILAPIREDGKERRDSKSAVTTAAGAKKERPERSEKEKARRAERDKLRREKRNQLIDEKKKERQLLKQQKENATPTAIDNSSGEIAKVKGSAPTPIAGSSAKGGVATPVEGQSNSKRPPKEVKKYSERRQEQRAKQGNESKSAEKNNNKMKRSEAEGDSTKSVVGEREKKTQSALEGAELGAAGETDKVDGKKKRESRRYSERRIRNKDRPAIKIYQPGKVRKADGSPAEE